MFNRRFGRPRDPDMHGLKSIDGDHSLRRMTEALARGKQVELGSPEHLGMLAGDVVKIDFVTGQKADLGQQPDARPNISHVLVDQTVELTPLPATPLSFFRDHHLPQARQQN